MGSRANAVLNALQWLALSCSVGLVIGGCDTSSAARGASGPDGSCKPSCEDACGHDDGCGGTCPCAAPETPGCTDTCESLGKQCGEVCGKKCGSCEDGELCNDGFCQCRPVCDGTRCDDGCGGVCDCAAGTVCNASGVCLAPDACKDTCSSANRTCGDVCGQSCGTCEDGEACLAGVCKDAAGCKDCALHLTVLDKKVTAGHIVEVTVAVEYAPSGDTARPRMADVRVRTTADLELVAAEAGSALGQAEKALYVDERTNQAWKRRGDGSYQMLAYGFANTRTLEPGRLMTLTFRGDALGPVTFSLVRRDQTFAPFDADQALQSSPYDQAVVVSR